MRLIASSLLLSLTPFFLIKPASAYLSTIAGYDSEVGDIATFVAIVDDFENKTEYYSNLDETLYTSATSVSSELDTMTEEDEIDDALTTLADIAFTYWEYLPVTRKLSLETAVTSYYVDIYSEYYGVEPTITVKSTGGYFWPGKTASNSVESITDYSYIDIMMSGDETATAS